MSECDEYLPSRTRMVRLDDERLIELVRKNRPLYDTKHPKYLDFVYRCRSWDKIGKQLQKPASLCKNRWYSIRDNYRKTLKKNAEQSNVYPKHCKYSDRLQFLRRLYQRTEEKYLSAKKGTIENDAILEDSIETDWLDPVAQEDEGGLSAEQVTIENEAISEDSIETDWLNLIGSRTTSECVEYLPARTSMVRLEDERLIELVRKNRPLYDTKHPKYTDFEYRCRSWDEIGKELQKPASLCKNRWRSIRDNYRKTLKKNAEQSNACPRLYKYSDRLQFLRGLYEGTEEKCVSAQQVTIKNEAILGDSIETAWLDPVAQEDEGGLSAKQVSIKNEAISEDSIETDWLDPTGSRNTSECVEYLPVRARMVRFLYDERLIELVRKNRPLYDAKHPKYTDFEYRCRSWDEIGKELQKPASLCKNRWYSIRDNYRNTLKKIAEQSNAHPKRYKYSDRLQFLRGLYEGTEEKCVSAKQVTIKNEAILEDSVETAWLDPVAQEDEGGLCANQLAIKNEAILEDAIETDWLDLTGSRTTSECDEHLPTRTRKARLDDERLIELVRKNRPLYDTKHPKYTDFVYRGRSWDKIGKELQKPESICKNRWYNIRDNYRKTLKKNAEQSNAYPKHCKYSDRLQFLRGLYEGTEEKCVSAKQVTIKNEAILEDSIETDWLDLTGSRTTSEGVEYLPARTSMVRLEDERLIELVRKNRPLYDTKHPKYTDFEYRCRSWDEIGKELQKPASFCKNRWYNIRDNYRKTLKKIANQGNAYPKRYKYSDRLQFLRCLYEGTEEKCVSAKQVNIKNEAIVEDSIETDWLDPVAQEDEGGLSTKRVTIKNEAMLEDSIETDWLDPVTQEDEGGLSAKEVTIKNEAILEDSIETDWFDPVIQKDEGGLSAKRVTIKNEAILEDSTETDWLDSVTQKDEGGLSAKRVTIKNEAILEDSIETDWLGPVPQKDE